LKAGLKIHEVPTTTAVVSGTSKPRDQGRMADS